MDCPGSRHSRECKRRQEDFLRGPVVSGLGDVPDDDSGYAPTEPIQSPAEVDMPMEQNEVEIGFDQAMEVEETEDIPMIDVCMAQPYYIGMLTSLALVQRDRLSVQSVQYDGYCKDFVVMDFCGQKIKLWKPSGAVSDATLRDLPAEGIFLAMQKEIRGLTSIGAGQVLSEQAARESGQRIIGTQWVTNEKEEAQEGVRARIVAKDFASGQSARSRSMGISSPTPSIEALRMILGIACGAWCWKQGHVFGRLGRLSGFHEFAVGPTRDFAHAALFIHHVWRSNLPEDWEGAHRLSEKANLL
eukprot:s490_g29.t1